MAASKKAAPKKLGVIGAVKADALLGDAEDFSFPYEAALAEAFPRLAEIQSEWLSALESMTALDRRTAELVRLACTAARRNRTGVDRHARLAAEVGATWPQIVETIMLTQPAFGVLPAVEALPVARRAFDSATAPETD